MINHPQLPLKEMLWQLEEPVRRELHEAVSELSQAMHGRPHEPFPELEQRFSQALATAYKALPALKWLVQKPLRQAAIDVAEALVK